MKRFFCLCSSAFALFSVLAMLLGEIFCVVAFILIIVSLPIAAFIALKNSKSAFCDTVVFISFIASAVLIAYFVTLPSLREAEHFDGQRIRAEGVVKSISFGDEYIIATVKCKMINGEKTSQNISLIKRNEYSEGIELGARLYFEGTVEFEDTFYNRGKECFLSLFPSHLEILNNKNVFTVFVNSLRNRLRNSAEGIDNSGIIKALVLGDKREVPEETEEDFKKIGTSHILAISGLHLSVIIMTAYSTITDFGIPHKVSIVICVALSLFYILITGFSPSLVRASQMMMVFFFSMMIRRKNDGITSLFFAGWCIMLMCQWTVFNIGFLLSFFSTFGIMVFTRPIMQRYNKRFLDNIEKGARYTKRTKKIHKFVGSIISASVTTLSATVFTLPIILFTINEFSMFSLIGNLIVVPITKYFLIFASITVSVCSIKLPIISYVLSLFTSLLGDVLLFVTDLLGNISPETVSIKSFYSTVGAILSIAIVIFFAINSKKLWALPTVTLIFAIYIPMFNLVSDGLIYNTVVVDTVSRSGVNTSLVRFKGGTYLLDQTSSASGRVGNIDDVISYDNISRVDKAVFIAFDSSVTKRINTFLSMVEFGELSVMTDTELDLTELQQLCRERDIPFQFIYSNEYSITENITAYCERNICSAFTLTNGEDSLSTYRSYTDSGYIPHLTESEIFVFSGKDCGLNRDLNSDGHYRLYA